MRKLLLATFFGTVILLIAQPSTVFGLQYNGAWLPNDGDVNYISWTALVPGGNPYQIWIYDFDNPSEQMMVLNYNDMAQTVDFTHSSNWLATDSVGNWIDLGGDPDFGIFFRDDINQDIFAYDLLSIDDGKSYKLSVGGMDLLQVDAMPQSVPDVTTVFLLGSGCLIGFVGLRRKAKS